ncbi:MAG: FAD-binding protein [Deltaproteobacteria bacterium]|nr:FAD-binding protein [Deltaproteobacteria bacterium]MBW2017778.1 FAD-binding protein [Deltaproteobacteria bacterium]MBW2130510.1 FAD-binding protein [Deltaproteobacteria bacterium]
MGLREDSLDMQVTERQYDVLVVGGGGAALTAASGAEGVSVLVVSKDPIGCGDTKISEGGITVLGSGSADDSEEILASNMRLKGRDLAEEEIVRAFALDSREGYLWLLCHGLRPYMKVDGSGPLPYPVPMGGHDRARAIPHPQGGLSFFHAFRETYPAGGYELLQDAWFLDLIIEERGGKRHIAGGLVYHAASGCFLALRSRAVILATGGLGTLFSPNTDNMRGNTGDGYAIAARAGASLVDMEQIQFIPFALVGPGSLKGLFVGEPASAGPFGVLRDKDGKVLLSGLMHRTRAEVAGVMARAVSSGRGTERDGCLLDLRQNVRGESGGLYYRIFAERMGKQISLVRRAMGERAARLEEPWEVQPSAHYCMGGILVDSRGKCVGEGAPEGLFAAGQAAGGLHGGDRLAGNSLAECIIFGIRAGREAARHARGSKNADPAVFRDLWREVAAPYLRRLGQKGGHVPGALTGRLQKAAWECLGPARTGAGLEEFLKTKEIIRRGLSDSAVSAETLWNQEFIDWIELENMLFSSEVVARSAFLRKESLGAHLRVDGRRKKREVRRPPYSIRAAWKGGKWTMGTILREPSPWTARLKDRYRVLGLRLGTGFLHALPFPLRERILLGTYGKWLSGK